MIGIKTFIFRDSMSIGGEKSPKKKICLEWWNKKDNLGDYLAVVVNDYITSYYNLDKNQEIKKRKHLMTIGSLIGMGKFDATIWGSGIHSVNSVINLIKQSKFRKYDIRIVRGPITRFLLLANGYSCPEKYGDPAVLMPLIYTPDSQVKKYPISVIYHMSQKDEISNDDLNYIDIQTKDYKKFVDEVVASELIISSSLHGIILAEAYGVPAIFLSGKMENEIIKFFDWYHSTGRFSVVMARTLEEALEMEPMNLPSLEIMQKDLYETFPKDLWMDK